MNLREMPGVDDDRDAIVLDALEPGQVVDPADVRELYRRKTDIRRKTTAKQRVRALLKYGPFEKTGQIARWRYIGGEVDT